MSGEFLTNELKLVQKDVRFDQTKQDNDFDTKSRNYQTKT